MQKEEILLLQKRYENSNAEEILQATLELFKGKITVSSSLSIEDQVITDMVMRIDPSVEIFTLDTGRMFKESYEVIEETNKKYNTNINIYFPNYKEVEALTQKKGVFSFYESIENRKECCRIRKIKPLKRALHKYDAWICGLRWEQSITRIAAKSIEWDEDHQMVKINPLISWTESDVWAYIKKHNIPYNGLQDKGFRSIGCQPCTRAVKEGESFRAGRWWWEQPENKECGLHVNHNKQS